jgi:hypothetical protein
MLVLVLISALAMATSGGKSTANESKSVAIANASKVMADVLKEREITKIALGTFQDKTPGNFGPGLQRELELALKPLKVAIDSTAVTRVTGEISLVDNENDLGSPLESRMLSVRVALQLVQDTEVVFNHTLFLNRAADIAQITGASVNFGIENSTVRNSHREIRRRIEILEPEKESDNKSTNATPGFVAQGTRIKSSANSPISVEIAVGSAASDKAATKPRAPQADSAFPLVPVGIGEMYEVVIHNDSDKEFAVGLTIDGLDQFTFSENRNDATGRPQFSHWIIPPKSRFAIPGWHITTDATRKDNLKRFLVTKYGDGASQYAPHPDKSQVGVITVSICESFQPGAKSRTANAETGFGPDVELKQTVVQRQIEPPHEIISIRYNK